MERLFKEEKERFKELKAPKDMEDKLRAALDEVEEETKKNRGARLALAIVVLSLVLSLNSNTIADFLIRDQGLDLEEYLDIDQGNINRLINRSDKIGESLALGQEEFIVEGGLALNDELVLFLDGPKEGDYFIDLVHGEDIISMDRSVGQVKDNRMKSLVFYDYGLDDNLKLRIRDGRSGQEARLDLENRLNPMINKRRIILNKRLKKDGFRLKLRAMTLGPLSIELEGYLENSLDLGFRTLFVDRMKDRTVDMSLIIDGQEKEFNSSSVKTDLSGTSFKLSFTDFPEEYEDLKIKINRIGRDENPVIIEVGH